MIVYHLLLESEDGYRVVKTYKRWASKPMMGYLTQTIWQKPSAKLWIVAAKEGQLESFSAIGMPSTYAWTDVGWIETRMPVRPLIKGGKK